MPYRATETTRRARQLRSATLLSEARSIVATEGFGAASIKAVATAAGVSAGTVYTYFADREELLAAVFREAADGELGAARLAVNSVKPNNGNHSFAASQLSALVEAFARRAIRGHQLAWALIAEPVGPLIEAERLNYRSAYSDLVADIVSRGVATGELPPQETSIVSPGIVGAIGEALIGPLSPLNTSSRESASFTDQVIDSIRTFCLRAVGAADVQKIGFPNSRFEMGDAS